MHIEVVSQDLDEGDARALIALLAFRFPHLMNSAAPVALAPPAAETAAAATPVTPAPEEAFQTAPALDPVAAFGGEPAAAPLSSDAPSAETPAGAPTPPPAGAPSIPPPPSGVDVDTDGLPWDARIHASTKTKNADGRWKAKKGVAAELKTSVTAELRAVLGAPTAPPPPPPAPTPQAQALAAALADPATLGGAAPPPPPPPAAPVNNMQLFADAMQKVTSAQAAQKLTQEDLTNVVTGLGLAQVRDLINRPDLIPTFESHIAAYVAAAG